MGLHRRLAELAGFFVPLGLTAFGGPAAHLERMRSEVVGRRGWLEATEFLDLVGACNLLPGPGSTQVAMAIGYRRGGWAGLLLAGLCFILPASLLTLLLAWATVRFGHLPIVARLFAGVQPVMLAIVVQAIVRLGRTALTSGGKIALALLALAATLAGAPPLAVLLGCGLLSWMGSRQQAVRFPALALMPTTLGGGSIFVVFLKLGVVVFGSGYVLIAFLQAELVDRLHWLTSPQILDAVTAGQLTPGPVFATATFLGYLLAGWSGAALATAGIFLPSFGMAAAASPMARTMRARAGTLLDGINAAAVTVMAAVLLPLGQATLTTPARWAVAVLSAVLLLTTRLNSVWLLAAGALAGVLLRF